MAKICNPTYHTGNRDDRISFDRFDVFLNHVHRRFRFSAIEKNNPKGCDIFLFQGGNGQQGVIDSPQASPGGNQGLGAR